MMKPYTVEFLRKQLENNFSNILNIFTEAYKSLSEENKNNFLTALKGYIQDHPEVKENYKLSPDNVLMIYASDELLQKSLKDDLALTKNVVDIYGRPNNYSKALKEFVKNNNIHLTEENYDLLIYDDFVVDSLENNYEETIKNLEQLYGKQIDVRMFFSEKGEKQLMDILKEHNFQINKETASLSTKNYRFKNFIDQLYFESDKNGNADEIFSYENQVYYVIFNGYLSDEEYVEVLMQDEAYNMVTQDFRLVNDILSRIDHIENLKMIGEDRVRELIKNAQVNRLRNDIVENEYFIKNSFEEELNSKQVKCIQEALKAKYSASIEEEFLKINGISDLEQYVVSMMKKNMKIKDLNLYQRAALQLYSNKLLVKEGIKNVTVSFSDKPMETELGYFDKTTDQIIVNLSGGDGYGAIEELPLRSVVESVHHEVNHVLQRVNTMQGSFDKDMDVFIYAKEDFLKDNVQGYYDQNYSRVKKEFDADMKAKIQVAELMGEFDDMFDVCVNEFEQTIKSEKYQEIKDKVGYHNTNVRKYNGNKKGFETLFQEQLEEMLKYIDKDTIKEKYPMIAMGYDLSNKGKMRSLEEMLDIINNSGNDKVKDICWGIILDRFNPERYLKTEDFDEQETLGYDDYGLLEKYNFKDEKDRKKASKIAERLERMNESTKYEQYAKEIKEIKEATGR